MTIRGIEYAIDQIVTTLSTYLPAELNLIDAERADGITLEDITNFFKYKHEVPIVELDRAILVYAVASRPLQYDSITNSPGRRVADDIIAVEVHVKDTNNEEPTPTQSRVMRYELAITRVLAIKYVTLGGTVNRCIPDDETVYTPVIQSTEDSAGQYTGSARMQFAVRQFENL